MKLQTLRVTMEKGKDSLLPEILKVMFIFLAALVLLAVISFFIMWFVVSGSKVEVPNVIGKSFKEAFDTMNEKKLRITIEGYKYSADMPEEYVVEQRPLPSEKVKEDRVVKVFLSQGTEEGTVPRVMGQNISEAETIFNAVGLEMGSIIRIHSDEYPQEGTIIAQSPLPNIRIDRGSKVNLLVSLGSYSSQLTVPNLGGMKLESALRLLDSMNLRQGRITRQTSPMVRESDIILEQTPQPDDRVAEGSVVDLVVSSSELSSETSRSVTLSYKVPARLGSEEDSSPRHVKIVLEHEGGMRIIADEMLTPGTALEYPLQIVGLGIAKIYVDDMEWPIEIKKL